VPAIRLLYTPSGACLERVVPQAVHSRVHEGAGRVELPKWLDQGGGVWFD